MTQQGERRATAATARPATWRMCVGTACERRTGCYRFRARPEPDTPAFDPPPLKPLTQACAHFWPIGSISAGFLQSPEEAAAWAAHYRKGSHD